MSCTEGVVLAFRTLGEAGKPASHAQCANPVAPAGEDFVRIGLVTHIPHQAVFRRIEYIVQRHGKLDNSEAGAQMPARDRNGIDGLATQLVSYLPQLLLLEAAQIRRGSNAIEKRRFTSFRQGEN